MCHYISGDVSPLAPQAYPKSLVTISIVEHELAYCEY